MKNQRALVIAITLGLAFWLGPVIIPFLLAVFIAILLDPMVRLLMRRKWPRTLASATVVSGFVILWIIAVFGLYRFATDFTAELPTYTAKVKELLLQSSQNFKEFDLGNIWPASHAKIQKVEIVDGRPLWTQILVGGMGSFFEVLTLIFLVPLLVMYLLIDRENLLESFNELMGQYYYLPKLNSDLPHMLRAFFSVNLITALVLILVHGIALRILGFDHWQALAVVTGVLSLLPFIGVPLAIGFPFLQGVLQFDSFYPFLSIAVVIGVTHFLTNSILLPNLMGARTNINNVALLVGILFWSWLWGAMGFLLAIPMTALAKILLESNPSTYAIANLLAAKPHYMVPGRRKSVPINSQAVSEGYTP